MQKHIFAASLAQAFCLCLEFFLFTLRFSLSSASDLKKKTYLIIVIWHTWMMSTFETGKRCSVRVLIQGEVQSRGLSSPWHFPILLVTLLFEIKSPPSPEMDSRNWYSSYNPYYTIKCFRNVVVASKFTWGIFLSSFLSSFSSLFEFSLIV